jgi:hypothetical protein
MHAFAISAAFYYAFRIPLGCDVSPRVVALKELAEGIIVIVPPTRDLLRMARQISCTLDRLGICTSAAAPA